MKSKFLVGTAVCLSIMNLSHINIFADNAADINNIKDAINKNTEDEYRIVINDDVKIMKAPSNISVFLGNIEKNIIVKVIEKENGWCKIEYKGEIGYIEEVNLGKETKVSSIKFIDNIEKITIYSENDLESDVLGYLGIETKVEIIEEDEEFIKIKYNDSIGYIENNKENVVNELIRYTVNDTDIYKNSAMESSGVATTIIKKSKVEIIDEFSDSYKIKYNEITGYVYKDELVNIGYVSPNEDTVSELKIEANKDSEVRTMIAKNSEVTINYYENDYINISFGDYNGFILKNELKENKDTLGKINKNKVYLFKNIPNIEELKQQYNFDLSKIEDKYKNKDKEDKEENKEENKKNYDLEIKSLNDSYVTKLELTLVEDTENIEIISNFGRYLEVKYNNKYYYLINDGSEEDISENIENYPSRDTNTNTRYLTSESKIYIDEDKENSLGNLNEDAQVEVINNSKEVSQVKVNDQIVYIESENLSTEKMYTDINSNTVYVNTGKSHKSYVDWLSKKLNTKSSKGSFVRTDYNDLVQHSNPKNYYSSEKYKYQFLRLDSYRDINAYKLNVFLNSLNTRNNIFKDKADVFIASAKKYDVDPIYLVSHTLLETGLGSSKLAQGMVYNGVKVHNFYGIGAVDSNALMGGISYAYENGWTSVDNTIEGSAKWLAENYIKSEKNKQNTLYKMRFNYMNRSHQYASDIAWGEKISVYMSKLAYLYEDTELKYEVPLFTSYATKKTQQQLEEEQKKEEENKKDEESNEKDEDKDNNKDNDKENDTDKEDNKEDDETSSEDKEDDKKPSDDQDKESDKDKNEEDSDIKDKADDEIAKI